MIPINFANGPVRCRDCAQVMRPTRWNFGAWPKSSVPYGAWGRCEECVARDAQLSAASVVLGEVPTAASPAEPAPAPHPGVMPRRRRRFAYTPPAADLCFSCGRPIDPLTSECRCSD